MTDSASQALLNHSFSNPIADTTSEPDAIWSAAMGGLILDLDGTLIRGQEVLPGAAAILQAYQGRYVIVSNNSTHTAPLLARRLRHAGLAVQAGELVLAGEQTVRYLRDHHDGARILMCASSIMKKHAIDQGCRLVDKDAHVVMLARDESFNYAKLMCVANELGRGAKLVVSNIDLTHPGSNGSIVPETGSLLQAVQSCSGIAPSHVVGKPAMALFQEGLRRLECSAASTLVIGDNPHTDALGAVGMGMRYLLVGRSPHADARTLAELLAQRCQAHANLPAQLQPPTTIT